MARHPLASLYCKCCSAVRKGQQVSSGRRMGPCSQLQQKETVQSCTCQPGSLSPSPGSLPKPQAESAGTTGASTQGTRAKCCPPGFIQPCNSPTYQGEPGSSADTFAWMAPSRISACWRKEATSRASCRASWCSFSVPCSRSHLSRWKGKGEWQSVPVWAAVQSQARKFGGFCFPVCQLLMPSSALLMHSPLTFC